MNECNSDNDKNCEIDPEKQEISDFAARDGVETLFRYMSYPCSNNSNPLDARSSLHNAKLRKWVEDLLIDGKLYFPKPTQMNDPFEGSPDFEIPSESPEVMAELFAKHLKETYAPQANLTPEKVGQLEDATTRRIREGTFVAGIREMEVKWHNQFRQTPMCCMSTTRSSIPMWSYYSQGHCGVCVHFDARDFGNDLNPFAVAMRVVYNKSSIPPYIMLPMSAHEPMEVMTKVFLTKGQHWAHEHEYRLVNLLGAYNDLFSWESESSAIINPQRIVGVTVGLTMNPAEEQDILQACEKHDYPVYKVCRIKRSYQLGFKLIRPKRGSVQKINASI